MTPEEIIKSMKNLVSLPDAVIRANELLNSKIAGSEDIGEVIGFDPALSARLLKLVNSAFYNFPNRIDTISRAITLIGTDELRALILASSVTEAFDNIPPETIDMDTFWNRSVYCGLVAKKLMTLARSGQGESMFLTGLLHDIGRLILLVAKPEESRQIIEQANKKGQRLADVELKTLGFPSTEPGAILLESWQLPKSLWEPIRFQHQPEKASEYLLEAAILALAIDITDHIEPELKTTGTKDIGSLEGAELPGHSLSGEELGIIAESANMECFEVLSIINPRAALIY